MKLLTIDIETFPHEAWVWGMHDQNIAPSQLIRAGVIASFAAKWHGKRGITFSSVRDGEKAMLRKAHELLSEADGVIGWNSAPFDAKWLQGQFAKHGMLPTAPFKHIDLLRTMRAKFRIASNKLEYAADFFGVGHKVQTGGFQLWRDCMVGKGKAYEKAWAKMERYNKADTALTEKIYDKLLPWISHHPNRSIHSGDMVCPACGGKHLQRRGTSMTLGSVYERLQCQDCGKWVRGTKSLRPRSGYREAA